jgi:type II secretory pathway pseudopilin PulG
MLLAVAVSGALLAAGSVVWSQQAQRERERELLLIGKEFRRAIGLYYERTPGAVKRYPEGLEDLLRDDRYLSMQRYLRRIYRDPITGKTEWGLVQAPTGGIMGVYSLSNGRPIKTGGFDESDIELDGKSRYSDWQFVYTPPPASITQPFRSPASIPK